MGHRSAIKFSRAAATAVPSDNVRNSRNIVRKNTRQAATGHGDGGLENTGHINSTGDFRTRRRLPLDGQFIEHLLLFGGGGALPQTLGFIVKPIQRLAFTHRGGH